MSDSEPNLITISPTVLDQKLDDCMILFDLQNRCYHRLDETGSRMLQLLLEYSDTEAVIAKMSEEYEVDKSILHQDLIELLTQLTQAKLIDGWTGNHDISNSDTNGIKLSSISNRVRNWFASLLLKS